MQAAASRARLRRSGQDAALGRAIAAGQSGTNTPLGAVRIREAQDLAGIETAMTEMNAAWTAASEDMYKATQEQAGAQHPGPDAGNGEQPQSSESKVEDVPFEEVK